MTSGKPLYRPFRSQSDEFRPAAHGPDGLLPIQFARSTSRFWCAIRGLFDTFDVVKRRRLRLPQIK